MELFIQEWYNDKNDDNYSGIYNVIKHNWKFEQYITDLNFLQRVAMCKFRCRSNWLPISQSRYVDDIIVGVDCLCPLCPGQIGNEIHYLLFYTFLLFCFIYGERQKFIGNIPVHSNYSAFTRYKNFWTQKILMIWRKLLSLLISLWKYSNTEMVVVSLHCKAVLLMHWH